MMDFPENLTILLEPTADCNLRCRHCYHADTEYTKNIMHIGMLDKLLLSLVEQYQNVKIIWHGGEPLLAGYKFFKDAYSLFEKCSANNKVSFKFGVQTNGTLLNDEFIELFKSTNTHISISFDGVYNSVLRQKTREVEAVISKLKNLGITFSCISTISSANVNHLKEMYEYFKKLGVAVKFNPIYPAGAAIGNCDFLISKEEWTSNFIDLFEYWLYDTGCNISFVSCIDILKKYFNEYCGCLGGTCLYRYVAIDSNGDIYPCGRLISDDFKLANIDEISDIRQAYLSKRYLELSNDSIARIENCKSCKWFHRCHSGCNASANLGKDLKTPYPFDCYFTRKVFEHIQNVLQALSLDNINSYAKKIICDKKN